MWCLSSLGVVALNALFFEGHLGGFLSRTTSLVNGEAQEGAPRAGLGVVFLQISPINRRHGPFSFMVDELIRASLIHLLDNIGTFPIW